MVLSDLSVRRPVLATVMSLVIIVFGSIAFFALPLRELPDVDRPVVGISVSYPGASAEVVETQITKVIEDQLSGIEGIDLIQSRSSDGASYISIEFKLNRKLEDAANDVRNAVSRARRLLPLDVDEPQVSKADADASPIMWLSVQSRTMNQVELSDFAERTLVDRFSVIDGVASVRIGGEMKPAMRVWIDSDALAARGLTVDDIENALRSQNIELPAGSIEGKQRDYSMRVERSYATPEEFSRLAISTQPGQPVVRLGDVARVEVAPEEDRRMYHGDGQNMVGIGIVRQSKSNALDVARLVKEEVTRANANLPPGVTMTIRQDSTVFIKKAIMEVYKTLAEAIALVVLVIFLFLGSMRAAAVPAAVIPVCLTGAFAVLAIFGFSINLLTLLALVLSIGIVVDDSIVVLENIQRRIDEGEPPLAAALHGARQVAFAVISTSLVLVAVFTPLLFVGGYVGKLFIELAATVAGVVLISMFCSLTLTPMMCSKLLRPVGEGTWLNRKVDELLSAVRASYHVSLEAALTHKRIVFAVFGFVIAMGAYLFVHLPSELNPREDRGEIMVMIEGPKGAGFEYTKKVMAQAEAVAQSYVKSGEAQGVMAVSPGFGSNASFNSGIMRIVLVDWAHRHRNGNVIVGEMNEKFAQIPGAIIRARMDDAFQGRGGDDVTIVLEGSEYEPLAEVGQRVVDDLLNNPKVIRPRIDYEPNSPRVLVTINRERAADLGVSVQSIGRTLESTMGSRRVNTYINRGEEYYVYLQAERNQRTDVSDLANKFVRSQRTGDLVPLSSVVSFKTVGDADSRPRLNRLAAVTVGAGMAPGTTIGEALNILETTTHREIGKQNIKIDYTGTAKAFKDSTGAIFFAFGFALLIVFLVLAAQFESFVHPFVIMLTVPMAVTGGLFGLYLFGSSLNIYSQIGVIILIALAAKNGILIAEFANQLRDEGKTIREAIIGAADLRLRPILMTSVATVIGASPLMLSHGAGAESRQTIGVVIVFGVTVATMLTLFVVPVFYDLLARFTKSPHATAQQIEAYEEAKDALGTPAE
jgi:multidrug efflux pump